MPKYNESNVAGEFWRRSPQIYCFNGYNSIPYICFDEENIILLSDGTFASNRLANKLSQELTPENANTSFQLKNPETEEYIEAYATYKDLFVLLHSLYFHLAIERDRGPKPFNSWVWSEELNQWTSPTPKPTDGLIYSWDEQNLNWYVVE